MRSHSDIAASDVPLGTGKQVGIDAIAAGGHIVESMAGRTGFRAGHRSWRIALVCRPEAPCAQRDMQFSVHLECGGSGCANYILAQGVITPETPARFLAFLKSPQSANEEGAPARGWRVFFDSVGGDLNAGLALGRILRKGGFDTVVGDEYGEFGGTPIKQRVVLHDSGCFSACAYAFMGGSNRQVRKDNALGVHQFYGRSSQVDEGRSQAMVTLIGIYLDEMGISRHLLDAASITPGARMTTLTVDDARRLGVDDSEPPLAP